MADFTDRDKDLLDKLAKAYEKAGHTDASRDPWNELYGREDTVNAQRAAMATDVLTGWAGSWAASYNYGMGSVVAASGVNPAITIQSNDPFAGPVPIRGKRTKLGLRGVPDIDFVPYNWRTNRFGNKGPSLVGHPISYEVEGPTLKSPFCDWTWEIRGGAGANGGDLLIMSTRADGGAATCLNMQAGYNVPDFVIGGPTEPNGGLYLLIGDDGTDTGSIPVGRTPLAPLAGMEDTARYEIFRVVSFTTPAPGFVGEIELHPNKPLSSYFSIPTFTILADARFIRAITVVKPYVTRLAAVAHSGGVTRSTNPTGNGQGRERSFLVVSPERAASSDLFPPYDGAGAGDGTWLQGGYTESGAPGSQSGPLPVGSAASYMGRNVLPLPLPIKEFAGAVERGVLTIPSADVGEWLVTAGATVPEDVGRILRIAQAERPDALAPPGLAYDKDTSATMGWWPIIAENGAPTGYVLSRVPEVDPETARFYFGPGPYVQNVTLTVLVAGTIHDPVSRLWEGNFDADRTESARLKNIIDPRYVARDAKRIGSVVPSGVQPFGSSSGRADKAIFDTQTFTTGGLPESANPGSLLDLGFRMTLFPAKEDGAGNAIPDFDKPIVGRQIIIDPDITEDQYIDIDYAGGIIRLSHPPPDRLDADSNIVPNGWPGEGNAASNNERGEAVLFAACVPYSMEENQLGTGNRVTARNELGRDVDVFSRQIEANIDLTNTDLTTGAAPFVGPSAIAPFPVEIVLDRLWEGPDTGVISMTTGGRDGSSFGNWAYTEVRSVTVGPNTVTALGGISLSTAPTPTDPLPAGGDVRSVVLRREVLFGPQSSGFQLTDEYELDTTYGSSARARVVRFDNADLTYQLDGSLLVKTPGEDVLDQQWHQWGYLSASGILAGVGPSVYDIAQSGTLAGLFWEDSTGPVVGPLGTRIPSPEAQIQIFEGPPGFLGGFFTQLSLVRENHVFRMVTLVEFNGGATGPGDTASMYVGFSTGSAVGGFAPTLAASPRVAEALAAPPPLSNDYIGLKWRGVWTDPATVSLDYFVQNGVTMLSSTVPTGLVLGGPVGVKFPVYFVIESSRNLPILKLALFDINMVKISQVDINDLTVAPGLNANLEFLFGTQTIAGGGRPAFEFGYVSVVNRVDLKAPKI